MAIKSGSGGKNTAAESSKETMNKTSDAYGDPDQETSQSRMLCRNSKLEFNLND